MGFVGRNNLHQAMCKKKKECKTIFRYKLDMIVNMNGQRTIIVIMKNPSTTMDNVKSSILNYSDKRKSHIDRTTGNVLRKLISMNYDRIVVLNLFPIYATNPMEINKYYASNNIKLDKYNKFLRRQILKYNNVPIVCAWGNASSINLTMYRNQIQKVYQMLNLLNSNIFCYDNMTGKLIPYNFNNNLYPLHGLCWK